MRSEKRGMENQNAQHQHELSRLRQVEQDLHVEVKKKEAEMIPLFLEWYSTKDAPLVYAFCFEGEKPKIIYAEKVIELYKQSVDKKWNDGVIYRSLKI